MKRIILSILFFVQIITFAFAQNGSFYQFGSYNLRIRTDKDTAYKSWDVRAKYVAKLINDLQYDVFGVQEVADSVQERDLRILLPSYQCMFWGRDSYDHVEGERIGILYKKDRFEMTRSGHFFLSETPEKVSLGWDSHKARLCLYARFRDKVTNRMFYYFVTHFDHRGKVAREESARLIARKIQEIAGNEPVVLVGDFNSSSLQEKAYQILSQTFADAFQCSHREGSVGTLNSGFEKVADYSYGEEKRIDFLFYRNLYVYSYMTSNEDYGRESSPSDHFPISATCSFEKEDFSNPVILKNKRITLITPTLFRLEYAQDQAFLDSTTMFAYDRSTYLKDFAVTPLYGGQKFEIKTSCYRMVVDNDNLPFGQQNTFIYFQKENKERKISARNLHSKTENLNLGGSIATLDRVSAPVPLDDGLLSRDGWYFLIDTGTETLSNGWFEPRDRKHVQDQYCFVYGDDFKAPFRDLGVISGKVPMTRKYMHGVWYSRWWPFTDSDVNTLIKEYREYNFPLDILSMDMDWHLIDEAKVGIGHNYTKGWTGYTWNRQSIPDPKALIQSLLKDSIHVCLNEHPHDGIRPHESMYTDFMRDMGREPNGDVLLFDAGDRNYMKKFFLHTRKENKDMGIAFWWLDWQQDWVFPYVRGSHMNHLKWLNKLYFEDTKDHNQRGAGYSRWGGWGDHRYPINFSGDATANWSVLGFEVKLSQTSGNQGCYYWAHDIGGFHGGTDPELLVRWTQFGALSAALRVHAARRADLDRRPWLWGKQATAAMRVAYHFRSEILPYIYSSIWKTHNTMLPLNRCMFVDYPTDKNAYNRYQQFMLGDLLLAAPITAPGKGSDFEAQQNVWFPTGNDWYDYFTDEKYNGGDTAVVSKTLDYFPLFVKGGSLLPKQPYSDRPASVALSTLVLRVYPGMSGDDNTFMLYEDDGISQDYEHGKYAETPLTYQQNGNLVQLTVGPSKGSYSQQLNKRSYLFEIAGFGKISSIKVNNKKSKPIFDEASKRYFVKIGASDIRKPVTVSFTTD